MNEPQSRAPGPGPQGSALGLGAALLFGSTVFTSAFLLFQVQPLIARYILPWFGASPGVWTTCMLFFQVLLLGGYAYAHFLISRVGVGRQVLVHTSLLLLAGLTLPITPDAEVMPQDADAPIGRILWVLLSSVGAPYLLLASTGPLLQGWLARLRPGRSPYRYYALSNAGSLLALLSYPFYFERAFRLQEQTLGWSLAYGGFALLCIACALRLRASGASRSHVSSTEHDGSGAAPSVRSILLWLSLSACGSALLLATTNQLCLDIASVPFLWIAPLALYLLSFILCFDSDRWYRRPLFATLLAIGLISAVYALARGIDLDIMPQVIIYCGTLFVACMSCHGELAKHRPAPGHLTLFFLVLATGGAVGGLFVAVLAPRIFTGFHEYPLLLVLTSVLVWGTILGDMLRRQDQPRLPASRRVSSVFGWLCWGLFLSVVVFGAAGFYTKWDWLDLTRTAGKEGLLSRHYVVVSVWAVALSVLLLLLIIASRRTPSGIPQRPDTRAWRLASSGIGVTMLVGIVVLAGALDWLVDREDRYLQQARNFYGVLRIRESTWHPGREHRVLYNGRIDHGFQYYAYPDWPVSYYGPASGLGVAIRRHPQRAVLGRPFRVGVVGLGTGIVAAYANAAFHMHAGPEDYAVVLRREPPDRITFYELNPLVHTWAETEFQYLSRARERGADVDVHMGDARLVLERQLQQGEMQGFDVLAIDAFTGDAIPIHLLTRESLEVYLAHLKPDGILAIHVSNRYLDLVPVVRRLGEELSRGIVYFSNDDDDDLGVDGSDWVVLTNNQAFLQLELVRALRRDLPASGPLWTDDYSSVFDVLKRDAEPEAEPVLPSKKEQPAGGG